MAGKHRDKPEFVEHFLPQTLKVARRFLKSNLIPRSLHACCFSHLAPLEKATCDGICHAFVTFASHEGSDSSDEAFLGRFLLSLPPVKAPSTLTRHFSEDSCSLYLPQRFRPFWRGVPRQLGVCVFLQAVRGCRIRRGGSLLTQAHLCRQTHSATARHEQCGTAACEWHRDKLELSRSFSYCLSKQLPRFLFRLSGRSLLWASTAFFRFLLSRP